MDDFVTLMRFKYYYLYTRFDLRAKLVIGNSYISEKPGQRNRGKIQILFDTKEKILILNIYFGRKDTSDSISHIGWSYSGVAKEND
jgi:hypothetical protein